MKLSDNAFFSTTTLTDVKLRVHDLERMLAFYRDQIGLREISRTGAEVALSATGKAPALVVLVEDQTAPKRPSRSVGLFHLALLFPTRAALATVVLRLLRLGTDCHGASDHGVSEAFYFTDPEENGVELYVDRPSELWPMAGDDVAMVTEYLDHQALLTLGTPGASAATLPTDTRIGHIHLSVADLSAAEKLFTGQLGFSVRQRNYPGALFFGRDGYHHHLASNIWLGTQRPPAGSLGLISFKLHFPTESYELSADLQSVVNSKPS